MSGHHAVGHRSIRLQRLTLRHFKGIALLTLTFDGQGGTIFGQNGSGKTTVVDAFHWLLFGKDSTNKKDFGIKTVDPTGDAAHNLEHEVSAVLTVDGRDIELKKVFAEKWTKKRGQAQAAFTGHTTDHFVDGVPVSEKEYASTIASLMDEEVFRLLTSPTYFNEGLHWQDRRQLLLRVVGDLSDHDVIGSNPLLADLPKFLEGRALEDHRKVVAARRRTINDELTKIPVRIDEAARSLGNEPAGGTEAEDVMALRRDLLARQTALQDLLTTGMEANLRRQLRETEVSLAARHSALTVQHPNLVAERMHEAQQAEAAHHPLETQHERLTNTITWTTQEIESLDTQMAAKRELWRATNSEQFEAVGESVCAACGQALPADHIQAAYDKALATFNRDKSTHLEAIQREGKALKDRQETLRSQLEAATRDQAALDEKLRMSLSHWDDAQARVDALAPAPDPLADPEYRALTEQKSALEAQLAQPNPDHSEALATIDAEIAALQARIERAETARLEAIARDTTRQRMADLAAEEKTLAAEFEGLEHQLYLMDQFTRTKVNALESRINARFQSVSFKLFTPLVNGGLEETAITTVNGVPYPDLNHAAKIQAGLEILNVLSAHYGVSAPVFIDGKESVSTLPAVHGQMICLTVSPADPVLRLVLDPQQTEKVAM